MSPRRAASRAGSRSGAARCPTAPSSSSARAASRGARRARRRRRAVAPPRRRPDARGGVPRAGPRRQAPRLRGADALRRGRRDGRRLAGEGLALAPRRRARSARTCSSRATSTSAVACATVPPMFTGIVREIGRVASADDGDEGLALSVEAPQTAAGLAIGDSISIDGVCLTAEAVENGHVTLHAVAGDPRASTLGSLARRRRGERRAGAPSRRPARRPLRPGPRRRDRPRALGGGRGRRAPASSSRRRRRSCATASRRARSRSTACR